MRRRPATLALFLLLFAQPAAVAQPATSTPQPPATSTAQPQAPSSAEVEKRLADIVQMFMSDPRYNRGKTPAQIKDSAEFVTGNVLFVLGHETAHALIAEFGIPVLGREEDAADALATIISLKMSNAFADRVVYNAARGWFLSDQRDKKQGIPNTYYDEHGMNLQRAYNIVCLMVGGQPDKFDELANEVKLPEERQGTCQGDFSNASWSWQQALKPHMRKPEDLKTEIPVSYAPTKEYANLSELGQRLILESVAGWLSQDFAWKRPIALEMQECGSPGAQWDLQSKKVIICYEIIREFVQLYRGYGQSALVPGPMMMSRNHKIVAASKTFARRTRNKKSEQAKRP
jgi:Putative metallopeptidase